MNKLKHFIAIFILAILVIIATYPLVFVITSHIPGFFSTDEIYGTLWNYWRIQQEGSVKSTDLICYPFGYNLSGITTVCFFYHWIVSLLLKIGTFIFIYNIQIIINFFLTAIFMYALAFYLTKARYIALFSSIAFAFCPYQFVRSWQHLSLTYNEWIPMCLLAFILLRDKASYKRIIFAVVSIILLFSFDYSIMYSTIVTLGTFGIYLIFFNIKNKLHNHKYSFTPDFSYFKRVIIVVVISFVILLPQLLPIFKNFIHKPEGNALIKHTYHKKFDDLFAQSVRPLSYLLPSAFHPVMGKFTEQFVGHYIYGSSFTEHTLYLGWTTLILAFIAFRRWRLGRKKKLKPLTDRENFYIGFFLILALVAWLFSQPPWWEFWGLKIYMPSFFMYKILPMFRAYCRFGIVLMLAVAVLAGFGLKFVLERFKSGKVKILMASIFCGLILFEFWNYPPFRVIEISKVPEVYYWLKEKPKDIVIAEYPLDIDSPNELYRFYQTVHNKRIINGTLMGSPANNLARKMVDLSLVETAQLLKGIGVKYVILHQQDFINTELQEKIEMLDKIKFNPHLKLIKSFPQQQPSNEDILTLSKTGPIDVYEVISA